MNRRIMSASVLLLSPRWRCCLRLLRPTIHSPHQARGALCRGRADRRAGTDGRRISRPRPQAVRGGREQGRCARSDRRRSGGAFRSRWLHAAGSPRLRSSSSTRCCTRSWPMIPCRDFRIPALITDLPVVMEIYPSVPAKTVAEFVAYAKQNPGKLNFGSAGIGGTIHLAGEMFKQMAGVDMVHVPYKGAGPALQYLLAGNIQLMFDMLGTALPPVKAGMLRPLGVSSKQAHSIGPMADHGEVAIPIIRSVSGTALPRRQRCLTTSRKRSARVSQPRPERRGVPRLAGKGRFSAAASEDAERDRQIRQRRSRALGGRGQEF